MINKQKIRKLAQIAASQSTMPRDVEEFVLKHMSKNELKDFLKFFKIELDKRRVYVISSDTLSGSVLNDLKDKFKDKEMVLSIDESLGAGLKIKDNDMVIDLSFQKYINDTIDELKN